MPASLSATLNGLISRRLVEAASDGLAESHAAVAKGLGLSFATLLGGLARQSSDPSAMGAVASLLADPAMGGGMLSRVFANAKPIVEEHGGVQPPSEPAVVLGHRLAGTVFGANRDGLVRTVSAVAGLDQHSADALMGLAAPMVLAALQHRLSGGETGGPQVAALLGVDRAAILAAVPAELVASLGFSGAGAVQTASVAAAPAMGNATLSFDRSPVIPAPAVRAFRLPDVITPAPPQPSAPIRVPAAPPSDARGPSISQYTPTGSRVEPPADGGWKSLLPSLLALAVVGLVAYLVWPQTPQVRDPQGRAPSAGGTGVTSSPPAVLSGQTTRPPVTEPRPTIPPSVIDTGRTMVRRILPNGAALNIPADGFENRLLSALDDPWRFLSSAKWLEIEGLNFEPGSAEITPETRVLVQRLGEVLRAYPTVKLKIGGYTDNQGEPSANQRLSEERAKAVRLALRDLGISADRLEAEGFGEASPVASNMTADGRARNRRIAVIVTQR